MPLDFIAPVFMALSTLMLNQRMRWGWVAKGVGAVLSIVVASTATYNGRPVYGFVLLGAVNLLLSIHAFYDWKKHKEIR